MFLRLGVRAHLSAKLPQKPTHFPHFLKHIRTGLFVFVNNTPDGLVVCRRLERSPASQSGSNVLKIIITVEIIYTEKSPALIASKPNIKGHGIVYVFQVVP